MFEVFFCQCDLFSFDFFLKLIDLMVHDLISSLGFSYFIFSLRQLLWITVSGRPNWLIEFLLLFESALCLDVLFLVFTNQVAFELNLFKGLLVLWVRESGFLAVHLLKFLNLHYRLFKVCDGLISFFDFIFIANYFFFLFEELLIVGFKVSL